MTYQWPHYPVEGVGGGIECQCGWPMKSDFQEGGPDWHPDYNVHFLQMLARREQEDQ